MLFRRFLEEQCGLSKEKRIRGMRFKEHVEVFRYWRELIVQDVLECPFELTHVDAHTDMGFGERDWDFIVHELLHKEPTSRLTPKQDPPHLNSGSFLAYAIAVRWISKLTFVHHTDFPDNNDYNGICFKDFDPKSGFVQLKNKQRQQITGYDYMKHEPTILEPEIPYVEISVDKFQSNDTLEVATICQSPGFTPESADFLLDVFGEYVDESWLA